MPSSTSSAPTGSRRPSSPVPTRAGPGTRQRRLSLGRHRPRWCARAGAPDTWVSQTASPSGLHYRPADQPQPYRRASLGRYRRQRRGLARPARRRRRRDRTTADDPAGRGRPGGREDLPAHHLPPDTTGADHRVAGWGAGGDNSRVPTLPWPHRPKALYSPTDALPPFNGRTCGAALGALVLTAAMSPRLAVPERLCQRTSAGTPSPAGTRSWPWPWRRVTTAPCGPAPRVAGWCAGS